MARVSCPVFVGRAGEVAQLEATLEQAALGQPAAVVVAGEAGVGKTRLVGTLVDRAHAHSALALVGGCLDVDDGVLPYGPIVEALRGLTERLPTAEMDRAFGDARRVLVRLVPELEPSYYADEIDGRGSAAPGQLYELLLGVLHRLAARRPVLLAIEDVHWADRSTRDLLAFLVRNLRAGVLLVLTYRSDDVPGGHPLRPWLAELERTGRVQHIELARFTRPELAELLAGILGHAAPPTLVTSIMDRSGGNAFYAEELAATHRDGIAMSRTLREVVLARVQALSEPTRRLLGTVAVAGPRCDHDLLAQVALMTAEDLVVALAEAIDHHLLVVDAAAPAGGYAFRHALVQETIYRDLLAVRRSVLHAAYARALARRLDSRLVGSDRARTDDLGLLASHWYAAQDLAHALPAYIQAGLAAKAVAAPAEALEHFQRAATLWHQVPADAVEGGLDRAALLEQAAEAAYLLSEHERAIDLGELALTEIGDTDPPRAGTLLARTARYHRSLGDSTRAAAVMGQALSLIPEQPASPERAGALAAFGRLLLTTGHIEEALRRSEQALAVARQVDARAEEGQALDTLGRIHLELGQPAPAITCLREALNIAVRVGDAEEMCRASHNLTEALEADGRSAEAAIIGLNGCRIARQHGLVRGYGTFNLVHTALLLLRLGRWQEGDELLDEVFQLDPPALEMFPALMARASGRLWRGDLDAARADLAAAAANPAAMLHPEFAAITDALRAELAIWEGRTGDATARVSIWLAASTESLSPLAIVQLCSMGLRAEAAISQQARRQGTADEAAAARARASRLLAYVPPRATRFEPSRSLPLVTAELASAQAEWSRVINGGDPAAWRDAATAWEQLEYPYQGGYARWRQAEALLASDGTRHLAADVLTTAWHACNAAGLQLLSERIAATARRARIPLPDPAGGLPEPAAAPPDPAVRYHLTPREREVLTLLADGLTNRQIAEALYISPKTASVHLSHILRKLDVAHRSQAAVIAHRLGLTT